MAYAFGALDSLGHSVLATYLSDALGAKVEIGSFSAAVLSGRLEASSFGLAQFAHFEPKESKALSIGAAALTFCPSSLLRARVLRVTRAELEGVKVVVSRHAAGCVNFALVNKARRKAFYDEHGAARSVGDGNGVVRSQEPASPAPPSEKSDDWEQVGADDASPPLDDFLERAGEAPSLADRARDGPTLEDHGKHLWGLFRSKAATVVDEALSYEHALKTKRRRSSIEELALQAFDVGRKANDAASAPGFPQLGASTSTESVSVCGGREG